MAVVVGIIIGSGIFRVPSPIAASAGNAAGVAIVWVLGGVISLFGALSMAELAAMYPRSGGPYVYLLEAYGRPLAFLTGWVWLITAPISWAAQSLTFADYLASFVPMSAAETHGLAAVLIVLLAGAQYRSVRMGALLQNVSTAAKLIAVLGLAGAIFVLAPHAASSGHVDIFKGPLEWGGVGVALVAVLWAYDGWENLTEIAGEIRQPHKNLPIALIGGTIVVIVVYLIVNAAYLRALPFPALAGSKAVATDSAVAVLGHIGAAVAGALVMLSVFGTLNGSIMSNSRVFFAMAEDNLFFKTVGRIHPRYETPYVAIAFLVVIAIIEVMFRSFLQLAQAYVLGLWPFLALAVIGIFILRRTQPDTPRPYKTLGYPVIPALFVLGTFAVISYSLYKTPLSTGISVGVTLIGIPLYFLWLYLQKRDRQTLH
jgi:APA family basic amino acid/polyamine antiporter